MEVDQPSAKEQALTAYRDTIRKHRRLETQMRHGKKNTTTSTLLQLSGGERERELVHGRTSFWIPLRSLIPRAHQFLFLRLLHPIASKRRNFQIA